MTMVLSFNGFRILPHDLAEVALERRFLLSEFGRPMH